MNLFDILKLRLHPAISAAIIFAASLAFVLSPAAFAFGPQSSNANAQWGFDFVETFDGIEDWERGAGSEGNRFNTTTDGLSRMPKLIGGGDSAWGYYSKWTAAAAPYPWIGSETASGRKIWRGTKSLTMDLGASYGPSRFGLWFGEGYDSFNVFHMAWIPRNMFPTSCAGGSNPAQCGFGSTGTYTAGQPWNYYASWKFGAWNMDCQAADCRVGTGTEAYGAQVIVPNWRPVTANGQFGQYIYVEKNETGNVHRADDGSGPMDRLLADQTLPADDGKWFGFEFQVRNTGPNSVLVDMWVYDTEGNSDHILVDAPYTIAAGHEGKKWDNFFFGGNNANGWAWGPTMQSWYYVDDFIVDDHSKGRIGPRYFAQIAAETTPQSPPNNITNVSLTVQPGRTCVPESLGNGLERCGDCEQYTACPNPLPRKLKLDCTLPSTRENGQSFLPLAVESVNWQFSATNDLQSYVTPRCGMTIRVKPGTYKVQSSVCLTQSSTNGKCSSRNEINPAFVVPPL